MKELENTVSEAAELLRSGLRLGLAMSIFGAQGLARTLGGRGGTVEALDEVAAVAEKELGPASREMLRSGERLRRDLAQLQPMQLFAGTDGFGRQLGAALITGGAGGARRTLSAVAPMVGGTSFERAVDLLFAAESFSATALVPLAGKKSPDETGEDIEEELRRRVQACFSLDAYTGLWQLEGLGYAYGASLEDRMEVPFDADGLPLAARMPVLTGAALALALRLLSSGADTRESARRHAELCRRWAPAGSALMLFEATGFVCHQLMPLSFEAMADGASSLGEEAYAAFYHGVGRALYLSLRSLVDSRHPLERAMALDDGAARRNAVAGVVWAATLVHLRHPRQLETLLSDWIGRVDVGAVEHGMAGAMTVWLNHLQGRVDEPDKERHVAAVLRGQAGLPLRKALEEAGRRVADLEAGRETWDRVYSYLPNRESGRDR